MTEQQACTLCGVGGHTAANCIWNGSEKCLALVQGIDKNLAERAQFESWVRREWPGAPLHHVRDALPVNDPRYGEYCNENIQRGWVGWQARAALAQPSPAPELERREYPSRAIYPDASEYAAACGEVSGWNSAVAQHDRIVGAHAGATRLLADSVAILRAESDAAQARVAEVETMVRMLEEHEWAEHVGESNIGQRLEAVITTLINEASEFGDMPKDWRVVAKSNCFVLMEGNSVIASLAGPQSELNAARIAGALSKAPVAQAGQVPDGWKLVPIAPTDEMWDAANSAKGKLLETRELEGGGTLNTWESHEAAVWKAMLAAAPAQGE